MLYATSLTIANPKDIANDFIIVSSNDFIKYPVIKRTKNTKTNCILISLIELLMITSLPSIYNILPLRRSLRKLFIIFSNLVAPYDSFFSIFLNFLINKISTESISIF